MFCTTRIVFFMDTKEVLVYYTQVNNEAALGAITILLLSVSHEKRWCMMFSVEPVKIFDVDKFANGH